MGIKSLGTLMAKRFSVSWYLIAVILGILCLLLLATVAVLGTKSKFYGNCWSCYGIKCYYFIPESKNWNRCKQTCQSYNSSLLKINDEDELAFIQSQTYRNNYWIGLSYDDREQKWKWINIGPPFGINYTFMNSSGRGQCAFLSSTRIATIECSKTYNCICEERIDDVFSAYFDRYKKKRCNGTCHLFVCFCDNL
ncbi:protein mago nashi homolog 2 isoform X4 [Enhydra lutris kenyoni]|uniref:Protein mago nashi homolog 2 isoform X4 n=1 Tax=Enhydra lutris kenyoni TaxID=391180 RepID=A0A2Y9IQR5_ENHLU|nr:protein mago nashi homolog 2 isoform X4 [Enhydra lutris kenyoni]